MWGKSFSFKPEVILFVPLVRGHSPERSFPTFRSFPLNEYDQIQYFLSFFLESIWFNFIMFTFFCKCGIKSISGFPPVVLSLFSIILCWFCFYTLFLPQLTHPSPQQTTAAPNTVQTLRALTPPTGPFISICLRQNNVNTEATAERPLSEPDYSKTPPHPHPPPPNHVEIWNKSQVTRSAPRSWLQSAAAATLWGPDLMHQNKQVGEALFVACVTPPKEHSGLWCLHGEARSGDVTPVWRGGGGRWSVWSVKGNCNRSSQFFCWACEKWRGLWSKMGPVTMSVSHIHMKWGGGVNVWKSQTMEQRRRSGA